MRLAIATPPVDPTSCGWSLHPVARESRAMTSTPASPSVAPNGSAPAALITDTNVHGACPDRFSAVRDAFAANLDSGGDVGASVAVFLDGERVVDLWGGYF